MLEKKLMNVNAVLFVLAQVMRSVKGRSSRQILLICRDRGEITAMQAL